MNGREIFFDLINRKSNNAPKWFMSFFNEKTAQNLLGEDNVPNDCLLEFEFNLGGSNKSEWNKKINYAKACGHFAITAGFGACIAFGHGGPGEFAEHMTETGENYRISVFETGTKKEVKYNPHFYHHYDYPVNGPEDICKINLPDPRDDSRYIGLKEEAEYYKKHGYIVCASLNGFFSGLHYFLYPYDLLLADILLELEFIGEMLEILGNFNLAAAEEMLKRGIDMINFCDDLGTGTSMLISPELYRRFFFPWHKKLANLCHSYGAYLHMHSHGNINSVMDDIYKSGVDILNPCDPCDGMDLIELKKRYGDKIIFAGGINKFFFEWDKNKQSEYIEDLVKKAGGGFILMDSGGVPENVTREQFESIRGIFGGYCSGV